MTNFDIYLEYDDVEQWIENEQFRTWVYSPSPELDFFWNTFLLRHPEKEEKINYARTFLLDMKQYFESNNLSEEQVKMRLKQALERYNLRKKMAKTRRRQIMYGLSAAASVILVGIIAWLTMKADNELIYNTAYGEWKTIVLPDSSKVQLNANSKLIVPMEWKKDADRRVKLEGEAFFEVSKKLTSNAKFTVVTADLAVEVLGTAFNVNARKEATEVFLDEGKIKLSHGDAQLVMKPGDFVAYSAKAKKITARHRSDESQVKPDAWKDGSIIFTKEYAFTIFTKLEEIYGVKIKVNNELVYAKKYTISVPLKDLETVIPILEKSMQIKIRRQQEAVIIE